jgi:hypothetical protein
VDVHAAALAEGRAVTHDQARSGSDVEAQSRPEQRAPAQLDASACPQAQAQRAQALAQAGALSGWRRPNRCRCR